jgi:NTE family protein
MVKTKPEVKPPRIALALQGGGSLGAYHIGAYKALHEANYLPDVVAGVSIGAFTAAIIAGSESDVRMARLNAFWDAISWPDSLDIPNAGVDFTKYHDILSYTQSCILGQPNFFTPRVPPPQLQPKGAPGATSYYDTRILESTLDNFVDFKRINAGKTGIMLGAVKVKTGELEFFSNFDTKTRKKTEITARHVMASGAMPPGFPGIRIDGDLYWDGGCVSNTPIEAIADIELTQDTLAIAIDLFSHEGNEPVNMEEVLNRMKDLQFASKTTAHIDHIRRRHNTNRTFHKALEAAAIPASEEIKELCCKYRFDILRIVYESPSFETVSKDCEFSPSSTKRRAEAGYNDLKKALERQHDKHAWHGDNPELIASVVHQFACGKFAS